MELIRNNRGLKVFIVSLLILLILFNSLYQPLTYAFVGEAVALKAFTLILASMGILQFIQNQVGVEEFYQGVKDFIEDMKYNFDMTQELIKVFQTAIKLGVKMQVLKFYNYIKEYYDSIFGEGAVVVDPTVPIPDMPVLAGANMTYSTTIDYFMTIEEYRAIPKSTLYFTWNGGKIYISQGYRIFNLSENYSLALGHYISSSDITPVMISLYRGIPSEILVNRYGTTSNFAIANRNKSFGIDSYWDDIDFDSTGIHPISTDFQIQFNEQGESLVTVRVRDMLNNVVKVYSATNFISETLAGEFIPDLDKPDINDERVPAVQSVPSTGIGIPWDQSLDTNDYLGTDVEKVLGDIGAIPLERWIGSQATSKQEADDSKTPVLIIDKATDTIEDIKIPEKPKKPDKDPIPGFNTDVDSPLGFWKYIYNLFKGLDALRQIFQAMWGFIPEEILAIFIATVVMYIILRLFGR